MAMSVRAVRSTAAGAALVMAACGGPAEEPLIESADLERIVLSADEAPPGMAHDETEVGADAADSVMITARAEEARQLAGFVDGRDSFFSGEGFLLSWAIVLESVEQADAAFDLYAAEFADPEAYGFDAAPGSGPGDEGMCDHGLVPATGAEESICLWRLGNAVMSAGGAMTPEEIRAIADEMIANARP
jgi:hypothetical protein